MKKPQTTFFVSVKPWLHSDIHTDIHTCVHFFGNRGN